MRSIVIKKDQSRLIPILLGGNSNPGYSSSEGKRSREVLSGSSPQGRTISNRLDIVLAGENASIEIVGLVLGKLDQEKSIEVNIVHAAPNTKSNVNVRAVLQDKSTFAFRGNVKIEKGAKGADAYLRSDVLLFDEAKMGDDTPALEILEPDVKAGHAATIGKVDEQMLFYLMSRGLRRTDAERMLIEGFVEPVKGRIKEARLSFFP